MQPNKSTTSASDTTATLTAVVESTRDTFKAAMEKQLAGWTKRIDAMKTKADQAKDDAKAALHEQIEQLRAFEATGKAHLLKMDSIAAEGWGKVKVDIEETWDKLAKSIEGVWSKVTGHAPNKQ